ncbi:discoidin domain-containing protein [Listeria ilorinensis]|uniref:discoidin domain-containing protein n=1 Tax=Listeria ilorinensis TaxID=2867439 RepID=UPI001EF73EED|nr:discoidin domain-containing protein [Listeria ilorinensis]
MKKRVLLVGLLSIAIACPSQVFAQTDAGKKVQVFKTSKAGDKDYQYQSIDMKKMQDQELLTDETIQIFSGEKGQKMLGIGGSVSESAVSNINRLNAENQQKIYDAYFSRNGSQYSVIRSTVGSADFSLSEYSYNDLPKGEIDLEQEKFSIKPDEDDIIPAIKRIQTYNPNVKLFAAPWSPPAWMKESGRRRSIIPSKGIPLVNNAVKPEYYDAYAKYLVKYLKAYNAYGIPIFNLSLNNETQNNPPWESGFWSTDATIEFIANHLGPLMEKEAPETELVIWDWVKSDNRLFFRDGFLGYNRTVLSNQAASKYIDGVAFHWYEVNVIDALQGKPTWDKNFQNLSTLKKEFPQIHLYATEGCQEMGPWINEWEPAGRYSYDIINDIENHTETWIDWNLVLDSNGGPTHDVDNKCHAPIMVNYHDPNSQDDDEVIFNPSYYVLKRLSKEIQPGTYQVKTDSTTTAIDRTAILQKDESVSLFLNNNNEEEKEVTVIQDGYYFKTRLSPNSMTTFKIPPLNETKRSIDDNLSITASSIEKTIVNRVDARLAVDSNHSTRWASSWTDQATLTMRFPNVQKLKSLTLHFQHGWDSQFRVEVSTDGQNWQELRRFSEGENNEQILTILGKDLQAKYIRFAGEKRATGNKYGYSLFEMMPTFE